MGAQQGRILPETAGRTTLRENGRFGRRRYFAVEATVSLRPWQRLSMARIWRDIE